MAKKSIFGLVGLSYTIYCEVIKYPLPKKMAKELEDDRYKNSQISRYKSNPESATDEALLQGTFNNI